MITTRNVIQSLMLDNVIVQAYMYSYKSKKWWKLDRSISVELKDKSIICIPRGFVYDMATVPKWLWSVVRPFNDGLFATLIHDYLYVNNHEHSLTRKQSDEEYLFWLKIINDNSIDNYIRFIFVRAFGWMWWVKKQKNK